MGRALRQARDQFRDAASPGGREYRNDRQDSVARGKGIQRMVTVEHRRAEQDAAIGLITADDRARVGRGTGAFSGFFGIGGGFLIVPGLIASTHMPILRAIGTSLVAVAAFGLTTALNYALSGYVLWGLAGVFMVGGVVGSVIGTQASQVLAAEKGRLNSLFAVFVLVVAIYMLFKSWSELAS